MRNLILAPIFNIIRLKRIILIQIFFNYITNPNYQISVTAARKPYLIGIGYGLNLEIFGYDVRFEYGHGYKENQWQKPILHIGFGKNF